ncbi:MAG: TolC family protein [Spirochaetes bacterium]|nr:TolC family protein [Spirochaetota bacterium]
MIHQHRNGAAQRRCITLLLCALAAMAPRYPAGAIDDGVKKMIARATGIGSGDLKAARDKKGITLYDAYALAVYNTERMAMEGENSLQARARREHAVTAFLPRLSLKANRAFPGMSTRYLTATRSMVSLYARLPIITGLDEVSSIKASCVETKIREMELSHTAGRLLYDVAAAYYGVLQAEKSVENAEEIMVLYERMLRELRRRVDIGRSRQSEILRTNSQIFKLRADIIAAKNTLNHARIAFSTVTGIEGDFVLEDSVAPGEPAVTPDDAERITAERWDVKAAKENVGYAKAGVLSAWGMHLPSAFIEGSYILYQETKRTSATSPYRYRDYTVNLGVEFPILGNDITFAKVREANSARRQAELSLAGTMRTAGEEILDSYHSWKSSGEGLDAYRRALASADDNYRTVSNEYRLNLVSILDVLTAITALQNARDDYETANLQHRLDRVRLGVAINEFSGDRIVRLKAGGKQAGQ